MAKNTNLMSGIAARVNKAHVGESPEDEHAHAAATPGPFSANLSGITNPRAPGATDARIRKTAVQRQVWVEPEKCRPWAHHNRAYDLLTEDRCLDLIGGFRSLGKQQRPAIVRALKGQEREGQDGKTYDYEIISGARRHWTVSWLRKKGETNAEGETYLFLVVVRDDLDDTAAFELSDAENRGQKDISDFERAREYRWALDAIYEGNVSRMAEAIQMDRSSLTRLVSLTEIPDAIVNAYPSILEIRAHHWRQLGPYFSSKERIKQEAAERILACARSIAHDRETGNGYVPTDGAQVLAMLVGAVNAKKRGGDRTQVLETITAKATGKTAVKIKRTTRGMTFEVSRTSGATKEEILDVLRKAVDEHC